MSCMILLGNMVVKFVFLVRLILRVWVLFLIMMLGYLLMLFRCLLMKSFLLVFIYWVENWVGNGEVERMLRSMFFFFRFFY